MLHMALRAQKTTRFGRFRQQTLTIFSPYLFSFIAIIMASHCHWAQALLLKHTRRKAGSVSAWWRSVDDVTLVSGVILQRGKVRRVVGEVGDWATNTRKLVAMDPAEVEFLAEKETVKIIPNFSLDKVYLIGVRKSICVCVL